MDEADRAVIEALIAEDVAALADGGEGFGGGGPPALPTFGGPAFGGDEDAELAAALVASLGGPPAPIFPHHQGSRPPASVEGVWSSVFNLLPPELAEERQQGLLSCGDKVLLPPSALE
eukprot:5317957-Prymnesium_polylepis.1